MRVGSELRTRDEIGDADAVGVGVGTVHRAASDFPIGKSEIINERGQLRPATYAKRETVEDGPGVATATGAAHNSLARALPVRDVQIYQAGFRAALVAVGLAVGLEWQPTQDTRAAALPSRFDDRF